MLDSDAAAYGGPCGGNSQHDGLLAQLCEQLAALQKGQAEAASAADVHSLQKQGVAFSSSSWHNLI